MLFRSNDTATTEIYTLSLHEALPISMTLLAVPVYLLYELGMVMARILVPGSREVDAQREGDHPA